MQSLQPLALACRQIPRPLSRRHLAAQRCLFSTSTPTQSGHSRWSKIKHDKAKADGVKNSQRSVFSQELATASKLFGPDPESNPRLADLISKANRAGFGKQNIANAILRGQGKSATGAALEAITIEAILPNNIACIIECETESRLRTIAEVKHAVKDAGGNSTPVGYLFSKKGRIVFEKKDGCGVDEVFEAALEVGALDVQEDESGGGGVVVITEPADTKATGEALSKSLGLEISESNIVWDANEDTVVEVGTESTVVDLFGFLDGLERKEGGGVVGVYMNIRPGQGLPEGAWEELTDRLG